MEESFRKKKSFKNISVMNQQPSISHTSFVACIIISNSSETTGVRDLQCGNTVFYFSVDHCICAYVCVMYMHVYLCTLYIYSHSSLNYLTHVTGITNMIVINGITKCIFQQCVRLQLKFVYLTTIHAGVSPSLSLSVTCPLSNHFN